MDDRFKESLSALMDDEADNLELRRLLASTDHKEVRSTWMRYHEVRRVMGQESSSMMDIDVSGAVAQAIGEYTIEEPAVDGTSAPRQDSSAKEASTGRFGRWKRGVSGLAVAASVAFAVVIGFQAGSPLDQQAVPVAQAPENQQDAVQVAAVPAISEEEYAQRLKVYLQRHAEQSAVASQQGMVPFARLASYPVNGREE